MAAAENPWYRLQNSAPYVLRDDETLVEQFNRTASPSRYIHVEEILPEPFVGAKDAPVVLLSNNPGVGHGADIKKEQFFMDIMRANLQPRPLDYPFVYLAPSVKGPHSQWWVRKLKDLINLFGCQVLSRAILNVPYFPYASKRYGHSRIRLPSQDYSFELVRAAVKREAVVVRMRKNEDWFKAVPELEGYRHVYCVSNWQNPVIGRNFEGYDKVVEAIRRL